MLSESRFWPRVSRGFFFGVKPCEQPSPLYLMKGKTLLKRAYLPAVGATYIAKPCPILLLIAVDRPVP